MLRRAVVNRRDDPVVERQAARQEAIRDDAEREHVGAIVDRIAARELGRRVVPRRLRREELLQLRVMRARIAPVDDAQRISARAAGHQDPLGADAAMDHAAAKRVFEDLGDVAEQRDRVDAIDRAGREQLLDRRALDELSREPRPPVMPDRRPG